MLPLWFTNSPAYGGISNAYRLYQGSLITYTNVHFLAADGTATFLGNKTYTLADSSGNTGTMYVYYGFPDIVGRVIPQGNIWRLTGPMSFYGGPAPAGYQIEPSTIADIVTTPPPAVNAAIAKSGGHPVLTWTAQPFMSYTVLRSAILSPNRADYLPVASGLTFNTTAGLFYDLTDPAPAFYMVISP